MTDTWNEPRVWVAGEKVTASKKNDESENFRALYPYLAGGDIAYRDPAGDYLARLAKGTAYELYRMNAGATAPELGQAPFVAATHYNATGHTYNSTTERNMPNSSATITLLVQSTVIVWANVITANASGNCWFQYVPRLASTNGALFSNNLYGANTRTVPALAVFTGVAVGIQTILLREKEGYGAGLSYSVGSLNWVALAIPEQ